MLPRRIILASILISCVLATACIKEAAKSLAEVQSLHAELTKKFGDEVYVNVNYTDKNVVLTVSFINSALNERTAEERFTVANYLSEDDESNVFAYGIQLEGEPGKDGVTVMPYFRTKGDVNVQKEPRPKMVQFDFASYSSTPRFPETVQFTFIADGKPVFRTTGTFQGNDAQFCYLPVSYPAFRQMIAAKSLTIKVGAKEYPLTPDQFGAVQKMGDYITE